MIAARSQPGAAGRCQLAMHLATWALIGGLIAVAACATAAPPSAARPAPGPLTVETDRGPIAGQARGGVREFLGIPFAAPPVGALRFRPPAPAAAWTAPRAATHRGPACVQPDTGFPRETSEDCLTLNVWAPAAAAKEPVLVWIHGGAFFQGSGGDDLYDGARLAERSGAIVVTLNYRVGALGFLAHRALAREAGRATAASVGLLDQRAALAWVQRNIGAFGGDPDNVTIFGESAGAWSVCTHLAAPGSRGLFARAIMQSGACSDALYFGAAEAEAQGDALAAAVGCGGPSVLDCLRSRSADAIATALPMRRGTLLVPGVWWGPIVDGVELPAQPLAAMRAGAFARVPLLIGWNRDEGILHTVSFESVSDAEVAGFVGPIFGAAAVAPVAERYAGTTPKQALTDLVTDGIFACNARRVARLLSAQGVPVFLYELTHALDDPIAHDLGATHSVELFFVFGNDSLGVGLSERERPLSHRVMDAWARFARSGDPGDPTLRWPRYSLATDAHLELDLQPKVGAHLKQEACDFWDRLDEARGER
jgi:para-nitrobenzyl esterase